MLGIDLIEKLLTVDSSKRWTTAQALEHTWLKVRERESDFEMMYINYVYYLKDEDMRRKAHQMMMETADKHQMPPPSLPVSNNSLY